MFAFNHVNSKIQSLPCNDFTKTEKLAKLFPLLQLNCFLSFWNPLSALLGEAPFTTYWEQSAVLLQKWNKNLEALTENTSQTGELHECPGQSRPLQTDKAALVLLNVSLEICLSETMIAETNQMNSAFRTKWMLQENISERNTLKNLESNFMDNKLGVQYIWKRKEEDGSRKRKEKIILKDI